MIFLFMNYQYFQLKQLVFYNLKLTLLMRTKSFNQLNASTKISQFSISNRQPTPNNKKKIILSKNNIPKINIRIDSLIKQTFNGISTGKIKNYTQAKTANQNSLFMQYINSIYQMYQIQNPINDSNQNYKKYIKQAKVSTQHKKYKINSNFNDISLRSTLKTETQTKNQYIQKMGQRNTEPTQQQYNISKFVNQDLKKTINIQFKTNIQNNKSLTTYRKSKQKRQNKTNVKQGKNEQSTKKQEFNQYTQVKRNLKKNSIEGKTTEISNEENSSKSKKMANFGTPEMKYRQYLQSQIKSKPKRVNSLKINQFFQNKQIPPIFRYCFMCENLILQKSILIHQKKCPEFQTLYTIQPLSILRILIKKIQRIKQQIDNILVQKQNKSINELKIDINEWMKCVQKSYRNGNFNEQFQKKYEKLKVDFNVKFFKLEQLSHKLKWFLKIRQQLKIKFQI